MAIVDSVDLGTSQNEASLIYAEQIVSSPLPSQQYLQLQKLPRG